MIRAPRHLFSLLVLLGICAPGLTGCAHKSRQPVSAIHSSHPHTAKATLGSDGPAPDLTASPPPNPSALNSNLPTLFIAGDSTAARGAGINQQGWGVPFEDYFDPTKINFANRARGGRSSRTYVTGGLWDQLLTQTKRGDIVLIQFGLNDGGAINDAVRARGSIPGLGEETQKIENQLTGKQEVVHTYGWYLRKMIADLKARGATPIILTVTVRNIWNDGYVERGIGNYREWAYQTARAEHELCADVTDSVANEFERMGESAVTTLYPQDHTHFNAAGAEIHAAAAVSLLKGFRPSPVESFLSTKGKAVEPNRFSWLQLPHPANPHLPSLFLIGDSTVRNGRGDGAGGQWGWGDFVGKYFDARKINVVNQAVGGTSSRTYLSQGHWARVLAMVKPGDFVMIQFGTNDNGSPHAGRNSLPGIGDEMVEVKMNNQMETVLTFGGYLRKYVSDIRAKGATPLICSLVPRKIWRDGKINRSQNTHAGWAKQVAEATSVPFVDLNELIARRYDALGAARVDALFADEHTHTTAAGADLSAQCVLAGLKALKHDPLETFLLAQPR